ncbi:MAG: hypothetical protein QXG03_11660, partial [Halalkalicoccus sp.]
TPELAGVVALFGLGTALLAGVEPGGYAEAVAGTVGSMVFGYAGLFAIIGLFETRPVAGFGRSTAHLTDD